MNAKLQTSILINLAGNLQSKARQYGQAFDNLGNKANRNFGRIRRSAHAAMQGLDNLGNRYSGLAAGFATGTLIKGVADFDTQMTRLKTDSNMTNAELAAMKKNIMDLATDADFSLDRNLIGNAVGTFVDQTGNYQQAIDGIEVMGLAMQGFGVDANTAGMIAGTMFKNIKLDTQEQIEMLDTFFAHFNTGSLSVGKFAEEFPELVSLLPAEYQTRYGITEMSKWAQLGSIAKIQAPEMTTAMKSMFMALSSKEKQDKIESHGVRVFEADGHTKRDPFKIFSELIAETAKFGGRQQDEIASIFDADAALMLMSLTKASGIELMDKLNNTPVEFGYTLKAASENAKTFGASLTRVKNVMDEVATENLTEPLREFADWLKNIDKAQMEWIGQMALAVGGMVLAVKAFNGVGEMARNAKGFFGKKDKPGDGPGNDLGGMLGVTPVYVVNMPGSNWGPGSMTDPLGLPGKSKKGDVDFPDSPKHKPNRWAGVAKGAAGLGIAYALYETTESMAEMLAMPATWAIDATDTGQWLRAQTEEANNSPMGKALEAASFGSMLDAIFSDAVKTVSEPPVYDVPNSPLKPELQGKIEIEMTGGQPRVKRAYFGDDIETFVKNGYTMGAFGG